MKSTQENIIPLKAPFPYFGGKSRASRIIWERFGDVPNYVECFAGSLAVLLGRPHDPHTETVNDVDCYLANAWRAIQADPDGVCDWCNRPVNEADLHAIHTWLVNRHEFREAMKSDPDFFDVKIAAWWIWGASAWIGSGWCAKAAKPTQSEEPPNAGQGVNRQLPHVGDAGRGDLLAYIESLSNRLRRVRVCCGDWGRVFGPSVTFRHGVTGILLDPPYADTSGRKSDLYANDSDDVAHQVREWAIANGENPELRVALCGYESEHSMPENWECVPWKAKGGYGSQRRDGSNENGARERIWFSPHCLKPERATRPVQARLFGDED